MGSQLSRRSRCRHHSQHTAQALKCPACLTRPLCPACQASKESGPRYCFYLPVCLVYFLSVLLWRLSTTPEAESDSH